MPKARPVFTGEFDKVFSFESYGVKVRIESSSEDLLKRSVAMARRALANNLEIIENTATTEHSFGIARSDTGTLILYRDGEYLSHGDIERNFFRFFNSMLRIRVAEHAVGRVFIHAGVVGWRGKAIVIPASSFRGKTTLVAELVKNGALYYSDEYAVLDENGLNHPFSRDLSIRHEGIKGIGEFDVSAKSLGGSEGWEPIPVGLVLITHYEPDAAWQPEMLTQGQGMFEIIPHTIPLQKNVEFSLGVLKNSLSNAIIAKSPRGDSEQFAKIILSFFENQVNYCNLTDSI